MSFTFAFHMTYKTPLDALLAAIRICGSQYKYAAQLGLKSQGSVAAMVKAGKVSQKCCLPTELLTGISRHDLRPDIYPRAVAAVGTRLGVRRG